MDTDNGLKNCPKTIQPQSIPWSAKQPAQFLWPVRRRLARGTGAKIGHRTVLGGQGPHEFPDGTPVS